MEGLRFVLGCQSLLFPIPMERILYTLLIGKLMTRTLMEDPYDAVNNPLGVIQMGLAENQVSFDLWRSIWNNILMYQDGEVGSRALDKTPLFHSLQSLYREVYRE